MKDTNPVAVCSSAGRVLARLSRGLSTGVVLELPDESGVHMPLVVEHRSDTPSGSLFLVAHYHPARGGRIPDPAVLLLDACNDEWVPISIETPFAEIVTAELDDNGVRVVLPAQHARLVKLVDVWMHNVAAHILQRDCIDHLEEEEVCSRVA